ELQKAQESQNIRQQKVKEAENEFRELETELRGFVREKDMQSVRLKSLESELLRNEEDRNHREDDLEEFVEKAESLRAEIETLAAQIAEISQKRITHEAELKNSEQLAVSLKEEVYKVNRVLDAKQNEYNLTKSLVDKLEGFPESVKFLKKNAPQLKNAPLLSDIFACPNEYKPAIEQYLEPYLSYYVVENLQEAVESIELLAKTSKGRANFFILEELQQFQYQEITLEKTENVQSLLSFTTFDEKYQHLAHLLLGNVYLVEKEGDIPQNPEENVVYIHKNGKFIRKKYVQSGGSFGLFEGKRLGRAKNLEVLSLEIADLNQQLMTQKKDLTEATAKLEELRKIRYDKELEPLNKKHIEKQRDSELLTTREKEHREFLMRVGQRTDALQKEVTQIQQKIRELTPEIEGAQARLNRLNLDLSETRELANEGALEVNSISARYNQANIQMIQTQNGYANLQRELSQKQDLAANLVKSEEKYRGELETVKADIEALIQSNAQDDEEAIALHEQKKALEKQTDTAEQTLAQTKNANYQEAEALEKDRKQRDALQGQVQRRKDEWNEIRLQISSLQERMSVEFQIEVDKLDASVFPNPVESYSVEVIEPQLLKTRNQVQSFGEINPMAVEAFTEMKERYDFIMQQCKDLREAKQSLLNTIAEIDGVAKEKFLATFHQVRTHFIEVFRSLFTVDDTCDLVLVEPDNPLDSEIDIIARPKGKRPLTITQLSGGEKTLTAVALLFSIYLIKPAPFCVFDEVDAPLDDANIDKFNNIIRDFSKDSQFIIVTHNKRTMASTNVMYGITMEDTGISRVLPVNLESLNLK
ncbi:MAG: chromosome segregation protein SMC, partial [Bacteroidia bacterium]